MKKTSCQIALSSSTGVPSTVTESLKHYTVFCFDFQSCVNVRLHKLGSSCSYRDKAKRPKVNAKHMVVQNCLDMELIIDNCFGRTLTKNL